MTSFRPRKRTLAILPVKGFDEAKQRLADELTPGPRRALAEAMFSDVLIALRRSSAVDAIVVITGDHGAQRIAGGHGASVLEDRAGDQGHIAAALLGIGHALETAVERALLVPGDCPALDPAELDELLARRPDGREALVIPDRHGTGTNALLLTPPDSLVPSFGPGSAQRHLDGAAQQGTRAMLVHVASLALDIDTPEDLLALQEQLAATHGGAAHTRGMLSQLLRSRGA
ncbi:MAG: 2-phospho-L-lactate guanylyltransferase [Solirubrobacteraceae bacterium]